MLLVHYCINSLGMISWFLQAMQCTLRFLLVSAFFDFLQATIKHIAASDGVKFQQTYMKVLGSKGPRFCSHRYVVNPQLALKSVQCHRNTPKRWQLEIWHEISSPQNWLFPHMKTTFFLHLPEIFPVDASRFLASKKNRWNVLHYQDKWWTRCPTSGVFAGVW